MLGVVHDVFGHLSMMRVVCHLLWEWVVGKAVVVLGDVAIKTIFFYIDCKIVFLTCK